MSRISPEAPLSSFPLEVGNIWRSRHKEPPEEVFNELPKWMMPEPPDHERARDLRIIMAKAIGTLKNKERKVLLYRFWFDWTMEECGKSLGVTKERIRQIEVHALRKLRYFRNEIPYLRDKPFYEPKNNKVTLEQYIQMEESPRKAMRELLEDEYQIFLKKLKNDGQPDRNESSVPESDSEDDAAVG